MKLYDALLNWLQIKIVSEARPDDDAARKTYEFFDEMLREDHAINEINVKLEGTNYRLEYKTGNDNDDPQVQNIYREFAERLLKDIENEPKYNQNWDC